MRRLNLERLAVSENRWSFITLAKATITSAAGSCALGAGFALLVGPAARVPEEGFGLAACLVPIAFGSWWIFRELQTKYSVRLARSLTIAFAICMPTLLGVTMPFGLITGGYDVASGSGIAILLSAFLGPILLTTGLSLLVYLLVRSIARQIEQHEG